MSLTVNVHEAKTYFSRLLDQAHAGEEIVISVAGKPYARLMPLAPATAGRQPGRLKGLKIDERFFEPLPAEKLDAREQSAVGAPPEVTGNAASA